jgi:hypothetical protein
MWAETEKFTCMSVHTIAEETLHALWKCLFAIDLFPAA